MSRLSWSLAVVAAASSLSASWAAPDGSVRPGIAVRTARLPEADQRRLDAMIAEHRKARAQLPAEERETLDRLTGKLRAALFNQPRQASVFSTAQAIMKSSGMRLDDSERSALAAYALDGIASGDDSQSQLLAATQQMQETQMSFNLQYLQLQSQMQNENRSYTAVSNIMKTRHDTVKNSINNVR